jgi:hypothetical protein
VHKVTLERGAGIGVGGDAAFESVHLLWCVGDEEEEEEVILK